MNRIEAVRARVHEILSAMPEKSESARQSAAAHLGGVAQACAMLAMRRGEDVETAVIAGMLHDIAAYAAGCADGHAHRGADMARDILASLSCFAEDEIQTICTAIYHHSDKALSHDPFNEILIDADVWQHCLHDPLLPPAAHEAARFARLKAEFGLR